MQKGGEKESSLATNFAKCNQQLVDKQLCQEMLVPVMKWMIVLRPYYSTPRIESVLPSINKLGDMEESFSDGFEDIELEGYRFVDINILAKAISVMVSPLCLQCSKRMEHR